MGNTFRHTHWVCLNVYNIGIRQGGFTEAPKKWLRYYMDNPMCWYVQQLVDSGDTVPKAYQILYSGIVEQRVSGRWWWTSWIASSLADIVVQKWDEKVKQREYGPLDIEKTSNPKNINSNRIRTKIFGQIHLGVLLKLPHKEELRVGNSPVLRWDSFILMLIFILILISRYLWRLYLSVIIFKFIFIPCPHPTRQHTWQLRRPGTKL